MRLKPGLTLREMGRVNMIVDANAAQVNLTNVYSLNGIAADVWRHIGEQEFTIEQVVSYVCEEYEVDHDTASKDVAALIDEWTKFGLVINE